MVNATKHIPKVLKTPASRQQSSEVGSADFPFNIYDEVVLFTWQNSQSVCAVKLTSTA